MPFRCLACGALTICGECATANSPTCPYGTPAMFTFEENPVTNLPTDPDEPIITTDRNPLDDWEDTK